MSTKITKYIGNDVTIELPVKDAAGEPLDVSTGYTTTLTLTEYGERTPALTLTSGATLADGLITWPLTAAQTTTLGEGKFWGTVPIVRSSDSFTEDFPVASQGPLLLELRRKDRP